MLNVGLSKLCLVVSKPVAFALNRLIFKTLSAYLNSLLCSLLVYVGLLLLDFGCFNTNLSNLKNMGVCLKAFFALGSILCVTLFSIYPPTMTILPHHLIFCPVLRFFYLCYTHQHFSKPTLSATSAQLIGNLKVKIKIGEIKGLSVILN